MYPGQPGLLLREWTAHRLSCGPVQQVKPPNIDVAACDQHDGQLLDPGDRGQAVRAVMQCVARSDACTTCRRGPRGPAGTGVLPVFATGGDSGNPARVEPGRVSAAGTITSTRLKVPAGTYAVTPSASSRTGTSIPASSRASCSLPVRSSRCAVCARLIARRCHRRLRRAGTDQRARWHGVDPRPGSPHVLQVRHDRADLRRVPHRHDRQLLHPGDPGRARQAGPSVREDRPAGQGRGIVGIGCSAIADVPLSSCAASALRAASARASTAGRET